MPRTGSIEDDIYLSKQTGPKREHVVRQFLARPSQQLDNLTVDNINFLFILFNLRLTLTLHLAMRAADTMFKMIFAPSVASFTLTTTTGSDHCYYDINNNSSLAAPGALAYHLQNQKWPRGGSIMAEGVWKGVFPQVFGRSLQLSLYKFFDPSTSSMRKDHDREQEKMENGK